MPALVKITYEGRLGKSGALSGVATLEGFEDREALERSPSEELSSSLSLLWRPRLNPLWADVWCLALFS